MPKVSPTRDGSHLIHYIDHDVSTDQTSRHFEKGGRYIDKGCKDMCSKEYLNLPSS